MKKNKSMGNEVKGTGQTLLETAKDAITSGNPIKIIAGIVLGVVAVAIIAIAAITKLGGK